MTDGEWQETTLGAIAAWGSGGTPKAGEPLFYEGGTIPWAVIADLQDEPLTTTSKRITQAGADKIGHMAPAGSVLVSMYGTIGRVAIASVPLATNQAIAWGDPDLRLVTSDFLFQWLRNHQPVLDSLARGATQRNINREILKAQSVWLPPLPVQRRIVDVVGALDAHIANLRAEADRVAELAHQTLVASLSSPPSLLTPLSDCMRLHVEREAVNGETNYPIFGVLNRGQGLVDKGCIRGVDTGYTHLNRVRAGQVVMRKLTAWEGPIAVVPTRFDGFCGSAEFPSFTLDSARLLPAFMAHLCRWSGLWSEMRQKVTGTVQRRKRLNPEQLLSVQVPVPPLDEQRLAADALDALAWNADELRREAHCAANFRSQLLESLLSREVEIPESYDALLAGVA